MEGPHDRRTVEVVHHDYHRPNKFMAEVHNRIRVLLTEDPFASWLSVEAGTEVLKTMADDYLQR
jgi:putative SOS response-associated peptidase YedK